MPTSRITMPPRITVLLAPVPFGWTPRLGQALYDRAVSLGWRCRVLSVAEDPRLSGDALAGTDGLVVQGYTREILSAVAACGLPAVAVDSVVVDPPFPVVTRDPAAVGECAAEHLLMCGCRSLAVLGNPERSFCRVLGASVASAAAAAGVPCATRLHSRLWRSPARGLGQDDRGENRELRHWLDALPDGTGIVAWGDDAAIGLHALMTPDAWMVRRLRLASGVDAPELESLDPAVSAVGSNPDLHAAMAIALLGELLHGRPVAKGAHAVPSSGMRIRRSSASTDGEDASLVRAMGWIAEHLAVPDPVGALCRELAIPRRTLERRFRDRLGLSPARYRDRLRIARARALRRAGLTQAEVAAMSGFRDARQLRRHLNG